MVSNKQMGCVVVGLTLLVTSFVATAIGEELRYRPGNPLFGGNAINGSYLLGSATAQRHQEAPRRKRDSMEEFSNSIKTSLLSRISREIAEQILGEGARESGRFSIGDTSIDFRRQDGQIVVDISDAASGGSTTIEIPSPQY